MQQSDREYTFSEIAADHRATSAKVLGLSDTQGHLGVGADETQQSTTSTLKQSTHQQSTWPSKKHSPGQHASSRMDGNLVVKDREVVASPHGRTYWVDTQVDESIYSEVLANVGE